MLLYFRLITALCRHVLHFVVKSEDQPDVRVEYRYNSLCFSTFCEKPAGLKCLRVRDPRVQHLPVRVDLRVHVHKIKSLRKLLESGIRQ